MSFKIKKGLLDASFWFSRVWLTCLAALVFVVDVGTNLYTNFQASDDNFAKERDDKIREIEQSTYALQLQKKSGKVADLSIKNSELMVDNNALAVDQIKRGERKSAKLWSDDFNATLNTAAASDTAYLNYVARKIAPILDEYNRKIERKKLTSFTGGATGIAIGVLAPIFSLFLMTMSAKPYDKAFKIKCEIGGYGAQALSSIITFIAVDLMFGQWWLAFIFSAVLLYCAPLLYESVAKERQRVRSDYEKQVGLQLQDEEKVIELEAKKKALEREETENRKKYANKAISEKSRMQNLVQAAQKLVDPTNKNVVPKGVPKDGDRAAQWFVENGEPYGLQIKLAEHCRETRSSFNRKVELSRLKLGKVESRNGKLETAGH